MTTPPESPFSAVLIARVVQEVLRRLPAEIVFTSTKKPPTHSVSSSGGDQSPSLVGKLITLKSITELPAGTRQILVRYDAVITPSAREAAADSGITFVRKSLVSTKTQAKLVIGRADCRRDVSTLTSAIAAAVSASQQLPASGLEDTLLAMALHVSRDGFRGILLSGRPALAVVVANRNNALRAITADTSSKIEKAIEQCGANVLVMNPDDFSSGALVRACIDFVGRETVEPPMELKITASPCACSTHSHF